MPSFTSATGAAGAPGGSSVGGENHVRRLDHGGDVAPLGQAQLANRLHGDRCDQSHAVRRELDVGYCLTGVVPVTRAGIWLRALSCMTDSTLSDQDGRGPPLSQRRLGPGPPSRMRFRQARGRLPHQPGPPAASSERLMHYGIVDQNRTHVLTGSPSQKARTCVLIIGMFQVTRTAERRPAAHVPADIRHLQARPQRAYGLRDDPA
jgi:hypothetical protein